MKTKQKYYEGDKVRYLPKISGLSPRTVFTIKHVVWIEKDEFSEKFGVEWIPTWYYTFANSSLGSIENDLKLVKRFSIEHVGLKNDLIAAYNEAKILKEFIQDSNISESFSNELQSKTNNILHWLGKYVSDKDNIQML